MSEQTPAPITSRQFIHSIHFSIAMKKRTLLLLWVVGVIGTAQAQNLMGELEYAGRFYRYEFQPKKVANQFAFHVDLVNADSSLDRIYEGGAMLSGKVGKGQVFRIIIYKSSKENGKWIGDVSSSLETSYNFIKNTASHDAKGSFATFAAATLTETVALELDQIDQEQAVKFAVEYLIINYSKVLVISGQSFALIAADSLTVRESLILSDDAFVLPLRQKFVFNDKNYVVRLTAGERSRFNLTLYRFESGDDEAKVTLLHVTYLMLRDSMASLNKYNIHFHLSLNNGYKWQTYPSSYLECSFDPATATMQYRPVSKISEYRKKGAPSSEKVPAAAETITKDDLLVAISKYVMTNYPKLLINN